MRQRPELLFKFRLALALGKTLAEIHQMPSSELVQWSAFSRIEPFGFEVDNFRSAVVAHTVFKTHAPKSKIKVSDFYPSIPKSKTEQLTDFFNYMDTLANG